MIDYSNDTLSEIRTDALVVETNCVGVSSVGELANRAMRKSNLLVDQGYEDQIKQRKQSHFGLKRIAKYKSVLAQPTLKAFNIIARGKARRVLRALPPPRVQRHHTAGTLKGCDNGVRLQIGGTTESPQLALDWCTLQGDSCFRLIPRAAQTLVKLACCLPWAVIV